MTFEELLQAAQNKRSIIGFHTSVQRPMPAAFVIGMSVQSVSRRIRAMKIYEKPTEGNTNGSEGD